MIIRGGLVFNEAGYFENKDVYIQDGLITEHPVFNDEIIDASGLYVVPGFVDIHIHGCIGENFYSQKLAKHLRTVGVTAFCPTSMTSDERTLNRMFDSIDRYQMPDESRVLGINMEGPYISLKKAGAQNPAYARIPDKQEFMRLNRDERIKLITIAPELDGAMDFIEMFGEKVNVSIGHSEADYSVAMNAFKAGANHVTHMFNAMSGLHHRDTAIPGAAVDSENVFVELICDGIHVNPSMIRTALKMYGEDRVVAISDAMEACDMQDGEYALGGLKVTKAGKEATLKNGTLAGSVTNLYDAFRVLVANEIPLEVALKMVTVNPAKSIDMQDKVGTLRLGAYADILLLDSRLNLIKVL